MHLNLKFAYFSQVQSNIYKQQQRLKLMCKEMEKNAQKGLVIA